jgi:hypothetical protein
VYLTTVAVRHCRDAYGLVATAAAGGWRFVYSGDTRPSIALEEAGRGATLLVHEATFEDALSEDAVAKGHSTVSEALSAARHMDAARLIITHFSARYPGAPPLPDISDLSSVAVAFDLMRVSFADLAALPRSRHALHAAFPTLRASAVARQSSAPATLRGGREPSQLQNGTAIVAAVAAAAPVAAAAAAAPRPPPNESLPPPIRQASAP